MSDMVNSANKEKIRSSADIENVPRLPPLDCAQTYSENPYEIDLSFRHLDIIAFKQQQRYSKCVLLEVCFDRYNTFCQCISFSSRVWGPWYFGPYLLVQLFWFQLRVVASLCLQKGSIQQPQPSYAVCPLVNIMWET